MNAKRVLAYGAEEAERLNHKHIGTEHLLLGLLREEKCFAAEILHERGLRLSDDSGRTGAVAEQESGAAAGKESSLLAEFSREFDAGCDADSSLDPLIGRDLRTRSAWSTDSVPPHEEQPGVNRRAGRGQDGDCGRPGAADLRRRRTVIPGGQSDYGALPFVDRGRHELSRPDPTAAEDDHEGVDGKIRTPSSSSMSCIRWWARVRPKAVAGWAANILKPAAFARQKFSALVAYDAVAEFRKSIEKDRLARASLPGGRVPPPNESGRESRFSSASRIATRNSTPWRIPTRQ